MPRHLGLTHVLKASGTAHTQEKSLKCTMEKKDIITLSATENVLQPSKHQIAHGKGISPY